MCDKINNTASKMVKYWNVIVPDLEILADGEGARLKNNLSK